MTDSTTDPNAPQDETTHFGYQEVPVNEKHERVAEVFRSVATRYDIMNDVMSLGTHRLIKRFTIELSGLRQGHRVLDLAGGTGDLSMRFSPIVGKEGHVVLADINAAMLEVGRDRIVDRDCNPTSPSHRAMPSVCPLLTTALIAYASPMGFAT